MSTNSEHQVLIEITILIAGQTGLQVPQIDPAETLTDLGFDSLDITMLESNIAHRFGFDYFEDPDLPTIPIREIATRIHKLLTES